AGHGDVVRIYPSMHHGLLQCIIQACVTHVEGEARLGIVADAMTGFRQSKVRSLRFIHAADIHLDSPLTGLSAYADAPVDRLRTATRDAFARLIGLAIDEGVDFMIIAGDLYDGNWKDHNTGLYFAGQMGRLKRAGIPVYLLYGNHDAESEMTRKLMLPDNVHVFDTRKASTFIDEN